MISFDVEPKYQEQLDWARAFVREEVEPIDFLFHQDQVYNPANQSLRAILAPLREQVRARGLWACHLPKSLGGDGYGQVKLALLNEILGYSFAAPTVFGTAAPDTGNAEIIAHFGTDEQKRTYLQPLLDGDIVSCYSMTEPGGGADPRVFTTRAIRQDDGTWKLSGRKWYSSNARWASFLIVFAVTDPDVPVHQGASLFLVPREREGVRIIRNVGTVGDLPGTGSEGYIHYDDVVVTDADLLGAPGDAFKIAQFRLGGGRVHHAMRSVAQAQKALDLLCRRALGRYTQGSLLSEKQMVQDVIAECWMDIQQFRLFVLHTAWKIDKEQNYKSVREHISAAKTLGARVVVNTVSKAMHLHGSLGLSNELPFGEMLMRGFVMGMADGPDEAHKVAVAKQVLRQYQPDEAEFTAMHQVTQVGNAMDKFATELALPGEKSPWIDYVRELQEQGLYGH
ncbi:acyl-CoA dehydrogenase family protein [Novosphingobium resinovorum]|uniref:Acyl-CoA dehydrogenase n=1 Tax=Novosphingobium resinovorum TaxID=158500 RepID=A0A1D8AEF4_9SPHN|nr:acyl-CoA dehydrogenase family protein [Novosphingobium resinovorum]AOR80497.1 acyl-CoA dehydrogenase [Novosphingobium resinovorum]